MSLDFRLGGIKNWENVCRDGTPKGPLQPTTEKIIFGCMSVGIGEITDANFIEFQQRLACTYAISEFSESSDAPSLSDIQKHIGLRTNVSNETRNQWVKRVFEANAMTARYNLRRAAEAAAKETADA